MGSLVAFLATGLAAIGGAAQAKKVAVDFEGLAPGSAPAGFEVTATGPGDPARFVVEEAESAPSGRRVLAQRSADETGGRYPLCLLEGWSARDVRVSVRFLPLGGKVDRAAGLVARARDKDHYYVVRANALEDNVRLYRVVDGKRIQFAGIDHVLVKEGEWHALGLEIVGNRFRVSYDEKVLFEAEDDTFSGPGRVGLWTKADSVTLFDDFGAEPIAGIGAGGGAAASTAPRAAFDFEREVPGAPPARLRAEAVPTSARAAARVVDDSTAPRGSKVVTTTLALEESVGTATSRPAAVSPMRRAAFLVAERFEAKDLDAEVCFRTLAVPNPNESSLRTAGLVLRRVGDDDYVTVRANAREDNVQLHRVRGGARALLGEIHHHRIREDAWHVLRVEARGSRFRVLLDAERLFECEDPEPALAGGAGLMGPVDGSTHFDALLLEGRDGRGGAAAGTGGAR